MTAMTHIETVTVGSGGAASVTFSAISADFTDLYLVVCARGTRTGDIRDEIQVQFNGDTGSNYTVRTLRGSGSSATSNTGNGTTALTRADLPSADSTANTFSNISYYIPNYTSSAAKSISIDSVMERNATESYNYIVAGLWNNSAAITSIKLEPEVADIAEFSSFSLYGITAGSDGIVTVS